MAQLADASGLRLDWLWVRVPPHLPERIIMSSVNDITGDRLTTKVNSDQYRDNWDRIFGSKKEDEKPQEQSEECQSGLS